MLNLHSGRRLRPLRAATTAEVARTATPLSETPERTQTPAGAEEQVTRVAVGHTNHVISLSFG